MRLASDDIVNHLLDFKLSFGGFTAGQLLLIEDAIIVIAVFWWASRRISSEPHKTGMVALLEVAMVWLRDEVVYPWLGPDRGRRYLGFFWTLFFFILVANLFGETPFPLNAWDRTPTANLAVTGALAAIIFVMIQVAGMRQHGVGKYWIDLVPPGTPWFLWPLLFVIEIIGLFTKPFALTVRLFANMTADHAILLVFFGFLIGLHHYASPVLGAPTTAAAFAFIVFITVFNVLIALIQAYIFTILSAIFISLAVAEEH